MRAIATTALTSWITMSPRMIFVPHNPQHVKQAHTRLQVYTRLQRSNSPLTHSLSLGLGRVAKKQGGGRLDTVTWLWSISISARFLRQPSTRMVDESVQQRPK